MYSGLAQYYDRLMGDVNYRKRTDDLCTLFTRYDRMPALLLDLACGTGGFSAEFAGRGVSVIGVDCSPEMLARAQENAREKGCDILYLCQNACELDLYGTVDGAVCCLDSLNHITDFGDLCTALSRVTLFLEKGRLFLFDVNTVRKHEQVLADNTFVLEEKGLYCVWSNEYDAEKHTTREVLDFFEQETDGRYRRSGDEITERAYTAEELQSALEKAGLSTVAVCGEDLCPPAPDAERLIYVTRKE